MTPELARLLKLPEYPPMGRWAEHAACRGMGADIFHPAIARGVHARRSQAVRAAKAICATCPVTTECLADAMALPAHADRESGAIRGGLTALERRSPNHRERMRAQRARQKLAGGDAA